MHDDAWDGLWQSGWYAYIHVRRRLRQYLWHMCNQLSPIVRPVCRGKGKTRDEDTWIFTSPLALITSTFCGTAVSLLLLLFFTAKIYNASKLKPRALRGHRGAALVRSRRTEDLHFPALTASRHCSFSDEVWPGDRCESWSASAKARKTLPLFIVQIIDLSSK